MKRSRTAISNNDLNSLVKKQKVEKSLEELLNEVTNGQFDDFQKYLKKTHTTHLRLEKKIKNTPLFNSLSNLGKALKGTLVAAVYLGNNNIDDQRAKDFTLSLKGTEVTIVNLGKNSIGDQGAKDFAISLKGTKVTTVFLGDSTIGPQGAKDFAEGLKDTKVTTVYLWNNLNIGPQGAKDFAEGLKDTKVTAVYLWNNHISSRGAKDFAISLKGTKVTTVDLRFNAIGRQGAKDFAEGLKGTQVTIVNLGNNSIGKQGAKDFVISLKGTKVTTIDLSYNNLNSESAIAISKFVPDTYLLKVALEFQDQALSEALKLNNQKLVLAPYYLACLNHLTDKEKLKYKDLPKLDQTSTSEDALKFAGGIFMHLSFRLRKQVLSHLPLIDQKSRANTYLTLAAKRQGKIQIEDQKMQERNEGCKPLI